MTKTRLKSIIKEVLTETKQIDNTKKVYTVNDFKNDTLFNEFVKSIQTTYLKVKFDDGKLTVTNPKHVGYVNAYYLGYIQ